MLAISAPTAGSGKSMVIDVISILVTGRPAAVIAQGSGGEETEKRLGALLLAGEQTVAIEIARRRSVANSFASC